MITWLRGKKTYIVGGAMLLYAGLGVALQLHDTSRAIEVAGLALGLMGLRAGLVTEIAKLVKK